MAEASVIGREYAAAHAALAMGSSGIREWALLPMTPKGVRTSLAAGSRSGHVGPGPSGRQQEIDMPRINFRAHRPTDGALKNPFVTGALKNPFVETDERALKNPVCAG
jgi:hypothetical protein